jgi:hypothetical protein
MTNNFIHPFHGQKLQSFHHLREAGRKREQGTPEHGEANLGFRCITAGTSRFLASASVELKHDDKRTIDEQQKDTAEYLVA